MKLLLTILFPLICIAQEQVPDCFEREVELKKYLSKEESKENLDRILDSLLNGKEDIDRALWYLQREMEKD